MIASILGVGRSGTTAVYSLLQEIFIDCFGKNVDFIYEPFLWDYKVFNKRYDETVKYFANLNCLSSEAIFNHCALPLFIENPAKFKENRFLNRLFENKAENILLKFIRANGRFRLLNEICPPCKFIFIIRNPLDVINSVITRFSLLGADFHKDDWNRFCLEVNTLYGKGTIDGDKIDTRLEKEVLYWYYMNKFALESFQPANNKPLLICYEDYVNRGEYWVDKICDHLDIPKKDMYYEYTKKISGTQTKINHLSGPEIELLGGYLDKYRELLESAGIAAPDNADYLLLKYRENPRKGNRKDIITGKSPNMLNAHIQKLEQELEKRTAEIASLRDRIGKLEKPRAAQKKENVKKQESLAEGDGIELDRIDIPIGDVPLGESSTGIQTGERKDNARGVMVYCPDITGHRHLYSAYITRFFLNQGYEIYLCTAGIIAHFLSGGRLGYERLTSPYLEVFRGNPQVHFIDIRDNLEGAKNELHFIRRLQEELRPTVSIFIDGDMLKYIFLKQLLPWQKRLPGRTYAIFCLSEFIHIPPGKLQALKELWLFIYYQFTRRHIFVNRVDFTLKFPLLNRLFFRCQRRFKLLTAGFCPDALLADKYRHPRVLFLPEPITTHLESTITREKSTFYARVKSQYRDFLEKNKGKHVLLMFGDLEPRKGYDLLLQLCVYDPECVCVRFGRTRANYSPNWQTIMGKEKLLMEERLFEVDAYIESQELIDFVFSTVRFMILPYKNYYRTSGVLIDVLRRGLPVLSSDNGVMAHIVTSYRVGRVFRDGDFRDLQKVFSEFKLCYRDYLENPETFNAAYSRQKCDEILSIMLEPPEEK